MIMKKVFPFAFLALFILSCTLKKADPEAPASAMLEKARALRSQGKYASAKDTIELMRKQHPTAFRARTVGIVVLDSIELLEAQDTLALLDSALKAEQEVFEKVQQRNQRKRNAEYYTQKNKVFHLNQRYDLICAKVKFFLRKIDIDMKEVSAIEQK